MEQTFNDLCHERVKAGRGLFSLALWVFVETLAAIIRENATIVMRCIMNRGSTIFLRLVISLIAIAALAVCVFPLPRMIAQKQPRHPTRLADLCVFSRRVYPGRSISFRAVSGVQVVKLHRPEQGFLGVIGQSFAAC
jgi:hypothetical protein